MKIDPSKFILTIIIFIFLPITPVTSANETVSFRPTDDSYIDSTEETSNFRNADLKVRYWDLSSVNFSQISYLGFSIALQNYQELVIVRFEISVKYMPYDDHTVPIKIWKTAQFSEEDLTYLNAPKLDILIGTLTIDQNKRWSTDLNVDSLKSDIEIGYVYLALSTDLDNSASITFDSQSDIWNPPKLVVTYLSTSTDNTVGQTNRDGGLSSMLSLLIIGALIGGFLYFRARKNLNKYRQLSPPPPPLNLNQMGSCKNCGSINQFNSPYCPKCGEKL